MIHTVPNPGMTSKDVKSFRENVVRSVFKDMIAPEQMSAVKNRKIRMQNNYSKIIRNNGGTNPILNN